MYSVLLFIYDQYSLDNKSRKLMLSFLVGSKSLSLKVEGENLSACNLQTVNFKIKVIFVKCQ